MTDPKRHNLPVNADRIAEDIDALARITEPGHPWTRRAFSPLFLEGRAYIEARMKAAGLETRIDAAGNLIGRRTGAKPGLERSLSARIPTPFPMAAASTALPARSPRSKSRAP